MPDSVPLLEIKNLSLRFRGQSICAIEDVSLSVASGEILCVVGESGCGKSVTAMSMMGLLPKDAATIPTGTMVFEGQTFDLTKENIPAKIRGGPMAMIFQEPMTSLNPAFRIGDQIGESVQCHTGCTKVDARARTLEMLTRVGLPSPEQRIDQYPHQFSGGQRQRVMIAMALANDPRLLIADEPTTALDVTIQAQILDLIRDLQRDTGMGTMMITHDLGVVAEVADTVAVMYGGKIVEYGPMVEVFKNPQHPYTIGLMASVPRLSGPRARLATIPGTVPTMANMPEGCRFRSRCVFATAQCRTQPPLVNVGPSHCAACHYAPLEQRLEVAG